MTCTQCSAGQHHIYFVMPHFTNAMLALQVAEVMADAHARDVVILDVRQTCDFADSMVIATGGALTAGEMCQFVNVELMACGVPGYRFSC